ncbi:hypothetical protein MCAP1_002211 [Malassezia caprae]|uniref:Uncharacterized protein n=1 Tax=Malassezia caprae TaxID=1381934 RepID=A0AAF0EC73_9BASI|nr:hypothetical protein MCAP1_002211 [Malassezia caprae]
MSRPSLVHGWALGRRVRWLSTGASQATCTVQLSPPAQALWRAERVSLLAHMQAAGMIGAKRADEWVPMRMPRALSSVAVWVDETKEGAAPQSEGPQPSAMPPPPRDERGDGGFSASDLLDPDAWIGVASAPIEAPRPAPAAVADVDSLLVHCRTSAGTPSTTEAMAGVW